MAKLISIKQNGDIILKRVRFSYLHVFEPSAFKAGDKKSYSGTFILDKKEHAEAIKELQGIITAKQKEAFDKRIPADKLCLRDGDLTGKDEYEGKYILVAREREDSPPALLDRDGRTEVKKSDDKIYSGAIGNVMFRLWTQDNDYGKRVNANLLGLQFVEHGEKFSGVERPKKDEMFDDEGPGEEGDPWSEDEDGDGDGL